MRRSRLSRRNRSAVVLVTVVALTGAACGDSSRAGDAATAGIAARELPVVAWTGDRLFVYGGIPAPRAPNGSGDELAELPRPLNDAALWDPTAETF